MSFTPDLPDLADDAAEAWEAHAAYKAGLVFARQWQADAKSALTNLDEYPPAHVNENGEWEISYWSPSSRAGLKLWLDNQHNLRRKEEWGAFYQEIAVKVGTEILGRQDFQYAPEVSFPGPDHLSFVFRRPSATYAGQTDFVDVQISTAVMLTPPPRRFTINLVRNKGERPLFGQFGGYEVRLGVVLPTPNPDKWWSFRNEQEYEARLREVFEDVIKYGLAALM